MMVMLLSLAALLVRDKFGPGVFGAFLSGRYFRPRREERVFMFMDLKSSTTIAEQLGETRYFDFLNETFKTMTPGILAFKGEIYQYVGDEIVISWPKQTGLSNANCINTFYEMSGRLAKQGAYFDHHYGHIPQFKAGLHLGHVTAGEIGIVKREIVYSGDVLNTTARIQSMCNELGVRILASQQLVSAIDPDGLHVQVRDLGKLELRGKSEMTSVVTFQE